jgi:hypothetical protein
MKKTYVFQTPFLLRKVHLLWKFTASDESVYTNDCRDAGDAHKWVAAETVDSVTLDKESIL